MFQFRLQSLLQHRKQLEDNCRKSLMRVRNELTLQTQRLNALHLSKIELQRQMQQIQTGVHKAAQILPLQTYLSRLDHDIGLLKQRIGKTMQRVAEERCKLMEAVKSRKMLDRLKETERRRYQRKRLKKDQDLMNEVASQRHIRNISR